LETQDLRSYKLGILSFRGSWVRIPPPAFKYWCFHQHSQRDDLFCY